jgi:RAQPRD family integrative conjugative element protein
MSDAAAERADLMHVLYELDNLESLIAEAEGNAVSTLRIRFQYAWLRGDLEKVKTGIREYLDTVPVTPRVPPPLAGDYIR